MRIVFATNNKHKLEEVRNIAKGICEIVGLSDIGCFDDIPETQETIEGNALQKAQYVHDKFNVNCFADDTGLEIDALNGEPGVYSARYAGVGCSFQDNVDKVLEQMQGKTNRNAAFRTVMALIIDGQTHLFPGSVHGKILEHGTGTQGFGYDPIFMPDGYDVSFAQMDMETKNSLSHRANACIGLFEFLKTHKE